MGAAAGAAPHIHLEADGNVVLPVLHRSDDVRLLRRAERGVDVELVVLAGSSGAPCEENYENQPDNNEGPYNAGSLGANPLRLIFRLISAETLRSVPCCPLSTQKT